MRSNSVLEIESAFDITIGSPTPVVFNVSFHARYGYFGRGSFNGPLFVEEGLGRFNFPVSEQEGDL